MDSRDLTMRMAGGVGGWLDDEEDGWRSEVGESYYLDMLRDDARNKAYLDGIQRSIQAEAARRGEQGVGVLDIGTGSGLLAMMAKRAGATRVTACECFAPVARSAAMCFEANGMGTQVQLVHKASTEMVEAEMQNRQRADILVNELYDTELLGEGILPTLRHAIDNLMAEKYVVIPGEAQILTVLVESPSLCAAHHPQHAKTQRGTKLFPEHEVNAKDGWQKTYQAESIFLDKLVERGAATIVSDAVHASSLSFQNPPAHGIHCRDAVTVTASRATTVHAVAYWWDLLMCDGDANPLATQLAGKGDRPSPGVLSMAPGQGFRDHWRQNLCFLPSPIRLQAGQRVQLRLCHDDWQFWFLARALPQDTPPGAAAAQGAGAGAGGGEGEIGEGPEEMTLPRRIYGGSRLRAWADPEMQSVFSEVLRSAISRAPRSSVCLGIGDGHVLSILAAEEGAAVVIDVEGSGPGVKLAVECLTAAGEAGERMKVIGVERGSMGEAGGEDAEEEQEQDHKLEQAVRRALQVLAEEATDGLDLRSGPDGPLRTVDVLMAEPFYLDSSIGAHAGGGGTEFENLKFWRERCAVAELLSDQATVMPMKAKVVAVAVEFESLRHGQEKVSMIEGFDLSAFCSIQPDYVGLDPVAYDLWMYSWRPLSPVLDLLTLDFSLPHSDVSSSSATPRSGPQAGSEVQAVEFSEAGTCHGLLIWLDWQLTEDVWLTGAPKPQGLHRQKHAVYFLPEGTRASRGAPGGLRVEEVRYAAADCNLRCSFAVNPRAEQ